MDKPFLILCGLGYFEIKLLEETSKDYPVLAIDQDILKVNSLKEQFPNVEFINADASSILTWKKLDLKNLVAIVSSFIDTDISLEICRIMRLNFHLDVPIIILSYVRDHIEEFKGYNAIVMKPIDTIITAILNRIQRNFAKAINIGLGNSEIIEVSVLSRSHFTDKKLLSIKAKSWHVAAIYRKNELIIPNGESTIKVNDKIVLVGNPKTLENIANIFLKGIPQFPTQYGSKILALESKNSLLYELKYLVDFLPAQTTLKAHKLPLLERLVHDKILHSDEVIDSIPDLFNNQEEIGLFILPILKDFLSIKLKYIFKNSEKPMLFARGNFPYDGVLAVLNSYDILQALESTIEIAKIFKLPFKVVFSSMPDNLSTLSEKMQIKKAQAIVKDFESVYKLKIHFKVLVDNPIKGTIKYANYFKNHLIVINYKKGTKHSFLKPNIAYLITKKVKNSIIVIPL